MKILVDMNLSPNWVEFLITQNITAIHWSTIGPASAPDVQIMGHAAQFGYYVLTNDLDFGSILAVTHGGNPSVIQVRADDLSTAAIGMAIVTALNQSQDALADGALLTVEPNRTRLRLLPLDIKK